MHATLFSEINVPWNESKVLEINATTIKLPFIPQMITSPDLKWSQLSIASDPVKSRGMEWILGMDGECAENLNNA